MRWAAVGCLTLALTAVTACSPPPSHPVPPSATPAPAPSSTAVVDGFWRPAGPPATLASGLAAPWSVVPLTGGGALISQRDDGAVLELSAAGELRRVGTVPGVVSGGESGLHGLAVHVSDDRTQWLYAYHGASADNRVVRMPLTGSPGRLGLGPAEVVFSGIPRAATHNGGRIAFGPDGFLYVTTGDAQQRDAAQNPDALGGKILRLTAGGDPAPGNPFGTAVWSTGHRNVQGLAWTADGSMWASEFGQDTWDELNRIEPGGNYGWPIVEGDGGAARGFVEPVAVWPTNEASPSGVAAHGETLFLAGLRGERLWIVDVSGDRLDGAPAAALVGEQGRLRDVVVAGESLWILTNNTDGRGRARPDDDLLLRVPLTPAV